ncbi:hypothetical protein HMPREF0063_11083 [Aeromicrobium marinum DSM 15272]|uniref:Uncharacterized protein n=1 Tax=Aeromicrobium marinum DSM 15272 TaxID=585531 RepID=E2SAM5_9ACTN|nr:hypothetical protein [Aeromicrobium marinum]EFQ83421.1 hypothetical protein HMPREF0063_11083 [Aeromicrobium marinum DSM 15272]
MNRHDAAGHETGHATGHGQGGGAPVVVDCDRCVVRGPAACGDCVVTVLLGSPPDGVEIAADEQAALGALADSGLVPPLRMVTPLTDRRTGAG